MYDTAREIVEKRRKKGRESACGQLLQTHIDMRAIEKIYRLKRIYNPEEDVLRALVYLGFSGMKERQIQGLLEAKTPDDVIKNLGNTPYAAAAAKYAPNSAYVEDLLRRIEYGSDLRVFRSSADPGAVMLAYLFLAENEVENIKHITEGIRYQVPPEQIRAFLIGAQDG
jgi:V/A-type H+-transporting ATPase subunit C